MNRTALQVGLTSISGLLIASLAACGDKDITTNVVPPVPAHGFVVTRLVADAGTAPTIDPNLVNPWGIAFGPTGILWVSNNGTGTSTTYNADGTKAPTTVTIPGAGGGAGVPTGVVVNTSTDFVAGTGPALFIFAGEDGTISGWNPISGNAVIAADRSSNDAVYKGIAIETSPGGANIVCATNFKHNSVDCFDGTFTLVRSFTDASIPSGFAPFGITAIHNQLYVTFAKQKAPDNHDDEAGVGNGFVDVFNSDGSLAARFASNGHLNSPWAVVIAPSGFGAFAGDVLVGNFGDGFINAFDPHTGAFIDMLRDGSGNPISIDGLWGLIAAADGSAKLYFSSGPNGEKNGLVGTLTPQ